MYFEDALSAQQFAKSNPGSIVKRSQDSDGYTVTLTHTSTSLKPDTFSPQSILSHLNQHVISQNDAKEEIAIALYYHHKKYQIREQNTVRNNGPVMLIGSTW